MELSELLLRTDFSRDKLKNAFAASLKLLREEFNYTQNKLESLTNIKIATLSKYENNKIEPTISQAFAIANAFNMSLEDFIACSLDYRTEKDMLEGKKKLYIFPVYCSVENREDNSLNYIRYGDITQPVSYKTISEVADGCTGINWNLPDNHFFVLRVSDESMYPDYQKGDYVLCYKESKPKTSYDGVIIYGSETAKLRHIELEFNGAAEVTIKRNKYVKTEENTTITTTEESVNISDCTFIGRVLLVIRRKK